MPTMAFDPYSMPPAYPRRDRDFQLSPQRESPFTYQPPLLSAQPSPRQRERAGENFARDPLNREPFSREPINRDPDNITARGVPPSKPSSAKSQRKEKIILPSPEELGIFLGNE
jgi:hypothetical protein